jgi:hypothetical protein
MPSINSAELSANITAFFDADSATLLSSHHFAVSAAVFCSFFAA